MKRSFIWLLSIGAVGLLAVAGLGIHAFVKEIFAPAPPSGPVIGYQHTEIANRPVHELNADEIESLTNEVRAAQGLVPLASNPLLDASACTKAQHMIDNDYWDHVAPSGETPWTFIEQSGYRYLNSGENLAYGFYDNDRTIQAWLGSPTHRANLMGDYLEQGVCVKTSDNFQGGTYGIIVHHFGKQLYN